MAGYNWNETKVGTRHRVKRGLVGSSWTADPFISAHRSPWFDAIYLQSIRVTQSAAEIHILGALLLLLLWLWKWAGRLSGWPTPPSPSPPDPLPTGWETDCLTDWLTEKRERPEQRRGHGAEHCPCYVPESRAEETRGAWRWYEWAFIVLLCFCLSPLFSSAAAARSSPGRHPSTPPLLAWLLSFHSCHWMEYEELLNRNQIGLG